MMSPLGFRPVLDVHYMAADLAEEIENESFGIAMKGIPYEEGSFDHHNEAVRLVNGLYDNVRATQNKLVDSFLEQCPRLFLAAPDGQVLEISKTLLLPSDWFYQDQADYLANRDAKYEWIDTWLWVVDIDKFKTAREQLRATLETIKDSEGFDFWEHPKFSETLAKFEGWFLCVAEKDFPQSQQALHKALAKDNKPGNKFESISKQVLHFTEDPNMTKAKVKEKFPSLSARQFDHHWRLAAKIRPEISKPGRKS